MTDQLSTPSFHPWQKYLVLAVISITLLLPFTGKAFHIDEVFYLVYGKYLRENPFQPFLFQYFSGTHQFDNTFNLTHTPLAGYINAIVYFVIPAAGEFVFHTIYVFFFVLLIISFYSFSCHFVRYAFVWSLLLTVSPAVFVTGQSIYPDLSPLSFAVSGLAVFSSNRHNVWRNGMSSLLLIIAWMLAYPMFIFTLLSPLADYRKGQKGTSYIPFLVSTFFFFIFSSWTVISIGYPHFLLSFKGSLVVEPSYLMNVVSFLCNLGGCVVFPLFILVWFIVTGNLWISAAVIISTVLISMFLPRSENWVSFFVLTPLFLSTGLLLLLSLLNMFRGFRFGIQMFSTTDNNFSFFFSRYQDILIVSWVVLFTLVNIFMVAFGTVRYIVPLVPPFILIIGRTIELASFSKRIFRIIVALLILTTFGLSMFLSVSDYFFANCYRNFFQHKIFEQIKRGMGTIYLVGKFGFRYYGGELYNYSFYHSDTVLREGDIVIHPRYCGEPLQVVIKAEDHNRLIKLTTISCDSRLPLRMVQYDGQAGFYCSLVGHLPYIISNGPLEEFSVYLVTDRAQDSKLPGQPQQ